MYESSGKLLEVAKVDLEMEKLSREGMKVWMNKCSSSESDSDTTKSHKRKSLIQPRKLKTGGVLHQIKNRKLFMQ